MWHSCRPDGSERAGLSNRPCLAWGPSPRLSCSFPEGLCPAPGRERFGSPAPGSGFPCRSAGLLRPGHSVGRSVGGSLEPPSPGACSPAPPQHLLRAGHCLSLANSLVCHWATSRERERLGDPGEPPLWLSPPTVGVQRCRGASLRGGCPVLCSSHACCCLSRPLPSLPRSAPCPVLLAPPPLPLCVDLPLPGPF